MLSSIDIYIKIFLNVIPARIIVAWLLMSFIVTVYLSSNLCGLYVYFLSKYLKRITHLAHEISTEKKVIKVFQNAIIQILFYYEALCNTVMRDFHGFFLVHNNFYVEMCILK